MLYLEAIISVGRASGKLEYGFGSAMFEQGVNLIWDLLSCEFFLIIFIDLCGFCSSTACGIYLIRFSLSMGLHSSSCRSRILSLRSRHRCTPKRHPLSSSSSSSSAPSPPLHFPHCCYCYCFHCCFRHHLALPSFSCACVSSSA